MTILNRDNESIADCGDDELLNDGVAKESQDCISGCLKSYRKYYSPCGDDIIQAFVDIGNLWRRGQSGGPQHLLERKHFTWSVHGDSSREISIHLVTKVPRRSLQYRAYTLASELNIAIPESRRHFTNSNLQKGFESSLSRSGFENRHYW